MEKLIMRFDSMATMVETEIELGKNNIEFNVINTRTIEVLPRTYWGICESEYHIRLVFMENTRKPEADIVISLPKQYVMGIEIR